MDIIKFRKILILLLVLVLALSIKSNVAARKNVDLEYNFHMHNINVSLDNIKSKVDKNEFDLNLYENIYYNKINIKALEGFQDKLDDNEFDNFQTVKESINTYDNLFRDRIK